MVVDGVVDGVVGLVVVVGRVAGVAVTRVVTVDNVGRILITGG